RYGLTVDPATEVVSLIGSKEGIANMAVAFVDPGGVVLVADPRYPAFPIGPGFNRGGPERPPPPRGKGLPPQLPPRATDVARRPDARPASRPTSPPCGRPPPGARSSSGSPPQTPPRRRWRRARSSRRRFASPPATTSFSATTPPMPRSTSASGHPASSSYRV